MGVLEALALDVPNFMKDVPRVPKCEPKWESTPNSFVGRSEGWPCPSTPLVFAVGAWVNAL